MSLHSAQPKRQRSGERGSIIIMTAIFMLLLFLMLGLCIDVSRIYMIRAELQNAADAAALSAARELNSGTTGINAAVARANNIVNNQGFEKFGVTISTVEFSVSQNGPFLSVADATASTATAATMQYVRTTTATTSTAILFGLAALGSTHVESRSAVAGMSKGINTICDFFPVAVALSNPNPPVNTVMTLNFTQGTNNSATLADHDYIVLEVPDINGNGSVETAMLSAGLTKICQSLNANVPFHMTPSSNVNNGPRQITDGINTRFNEYANGYGNGLQPSVFPPDTNVQEGITFDQYDNGTAVTPPSPNAPGQDDRRILLVPIVAPGTYTGTPVSAPTLKFGAFFLKQKAFVDSPCSQTSNCGDLEVEWIDESLIISRGTFNPNGCSSNFSLAVLYQ
jgi:Flp pilus assembly protein TadG